jgi:DNA ligase-1
MIVHSLEDAYKHYAELLAVGKEGTVLKKGTAIWGDYTSKEQIKLKLEFDVDLEVIAVEAADANSKNAGRSGALRCKTSDDKLFVSVAIKNEKMRDEVDADPDDWISKIITVRSNAMMKPSQSNENCSLFLPRMVEAVYRTDKSVADSLLQVFAQEEATKSGAAIALKKAA